jgi:hypothetical protein
MTIDDLFRKFGGREAVMALTNSSRTALNNWRHDGVPYRHWPTLIKAAAANNIEGIDMDTLALLRPQQRTAECA